MLPLLLLLALLTPAHAHTDLTCHRAPELPAQTTFSASQDNWLWLRAAWRGVPGAHTAHYRLRSPDGAVYQDIAVPFTAAHGPAVTWASTPIAGTQLSRLLGQWTVELRLDSAPRPVTVGHWELVE